MRIIYYLVFVLAFNSCASKNEVIVIDEKISNEKTDKHISITGTRLYLVPPPGFEKNSNIIGLTKGEYAMMNVMELVGGNYYTNAATFTKESFESAGVKVFDFKEINVNGFPAKFAHMESDNDSYTFALVFGDTTFSTMLMNVYPAKDKKTGEDILRALNSIYYDKNKKTDPFETANFTFDDKDSRFKFFQHNANLFIYTIDGIERINKDVEPFLIISQIPRDENTNAQEIAEMLLGKMQESGFRNVNLKNPLTKKVNDTDTFEIEAYGEINNRKCLIYYCVLTKGDKVVTVQGISNIEMETDLKDFKKLAYNIKVK